MSPRRLDSQSPVFTKRWHNKPYPTISPTRPANSAREKFMIAIGGGIGIGAAIAKNFAKAGAAGIDLIGRREEQLKSSSKAISVISGKSKVEYVTTDVTDKKALDAAFTRFGESLGKVDVLVSNAGYFSKGEMSSADGDDWWRSFEVNVKGSFNAVRLSLHMPNRTLLC